MDVYNMYVGDCSSTFRTNMFRDYEKHPYGTFEGNQQQQQRKSYYTMVQGKYREIQKHTHCRRIHSDLVIFVMMH